MYCSDNCKTVPPHHSVCLCHITKDYGTSRVHWGRGGGGERGTVLQSRAWCSFRISPRQLDHLLFTYKIYWTHWIIVIIGPCVTTEKRKLYLSPKNSYLHKNNESALFVFLLLLFFFWLKGQSPFHCSWLVNTGFYSFPSLLCSAVWNTMYFVGWILPGVNTVVVNSMGRKIIQEYVICKKKKIICRFLHPKWYCIPRPFLHVDSKTGRYS